MDEALAQARAAEILAALDDLAEPLVVNGHVLAHVPIETIVEFVLARDASWEDRIRFMQLRAGEPQNGLLDAAGRPIE